MWVVCPCVCDCLQKAGKDIRTPGLELEVIVNHLLWMLGTKSFLFARASSVSTTEASFQSLQVL